MDIDYFLHQDLYFNIAKSMVVLAVAVVLLHSIKKAFLQVEDKFTTLETHESRENIRRRQTLTRITKRALIIGVWLITLFIILREFNIDMGPLLASAGIIGLAIGFGAQNLVKDILSGIFLIFEEHLHVGDEVEINSFKGRVERLFFRTTRLRDDSGAIHIIPNGNIKSLSNYSRNWGSVRFELKIHIENDTDVVLLREKIDHAIINHKELSDRLYSQDNNALALFAADRQSLTFKGNIKISADSELCREIVLNTIRDLLQREKLEFSIISL